MKFPKIKKKRKYEKNCYNCKYLVDCKNTAKHRDNICDKFKFSYLCKSS